MKSANRIRLVIIAASVITPAICGAAQPSPYTGAATRYAEALLKYGRDHYGPVKTPLWVHMLDLRTLEVPRQRTAAEWRSEMATWVEDRNYLMWGKDRSSVRWAQDSNLLWDTESVRLFYAISKQFNDPRFAAAADEYLKYFLLHCVSPATGLFAWGEHVAYNVADDRIHGERHELQHADPLWDELWRLDPNRVRREIEALYRYHVTDKRSMAYDRHASFQDGLPERDQATILNYSGTFITAWGFLYRKTGDAKYLEWARRLLISQQSKADRYGLFPDNWTDSQARELPLSYPVRPAFAMMLYRAYDLFQDSRWLDDANRYLAASSGRMQFEMDDGHPKLPQAWGPIADFAKASLRLYQTTGGRTALEKAIEVGNLVISTPQPKAQMASQLADRLEFLLTLYTGTGEARWLQGAHKLGDYALHAFVHPSGLIRGTAIVNRPDYYDAIQGPGALALALYHLGELDNARFEPRPVSPPPAGSDVTGPAIVIAPFPAEASNRSDLAISARISDPAGISRATLHYAYGNHIGFEDNAPQSVGGTFTFHIKPPGIAFIGEVSFAVEAADRDARRNRAISPWRKLKLVTEERQTASAGEIRLESLGLAFHAVPQGASTKIKVSKWLPTGVKPPTKGLVSIGRFFQVDASFDAARISVSYTPEETWRLMEPTLALARWDGYSWVRVHSDLDTATRTVTGSFSRADYWTLLGEDRVLWRADGRETGPALADLDGDGRLEILTTLFQPGELLSSTGRPIRMFAIDAPYWPVKNSSSPAVARLTPTGESVLLFVGPSGYLYAYDSAGHLNWRTEIGGEALGGPAVGPLLPGGKPGVAVAWTGGVSVIDAAGRLVWQRQLPVPYGASPVLVDLDQDGLMEIVVNAGSSLVALHGSTGRAVWEYSIEGSRFATVAAGEFIKGGKPRVVAGDDQGVVYALDESGKALWHQDRIYGPREVPEPVERYAGIFQVGLADLDRTGERKIVASTRSGETVALSARGERLWRFASYERRVGISLGRGAYLAFADLDNDGKLEVILSQQDSYVYVLGADGREKWSYLGYFWYHFPPVVGDLQGTGELNLVFTSPEPGGTYALRSGSRGKPGRNPWPMAGGSLTRANCAPW